MYVGFVVFVGRLEWKLEVVRKVRCKVVFLNFVLVFAVFEFFGF